MFCSQCGTAADSAAVSCAQCGYDFTVQPRPAINTQRVTEASRGALRAMTLMLRDPVGSIGLAYDTLSPSHALDVGLALCAAFIVSCLIATRMIAGAAQRLGGGFFTVSIGIKEIATILLVAVVPVISIIAILTALQMVAKRERDLKRAIFAGAAVLMPIAIFNVVGGILGVANSEVLALVALFSLCYTILLIYAGCRDILHVSSPASAAAVPVILIATAWLTKVILVAMM